MPIRRVRRRPITDARREHRADARRGHGARARAQPRSRRRAAQPEDPGLQPRAAPRRLPADRDVARSASASRVQPPTSPLNGGTIVENDTTTYNAGVTQALPWSGGNVAVPFNNNKQVTSNNLFANFNPAFNTNFAPTLTQPLLRDFLIDGTRQQLKVTAHQSRHLRDPAARHARDHASPTCATPTGSWSSPCRRSTSRKGSLDLADKLVQDNQARVEVGTHGAARRRAGARPKPRRGGRRWPRPRRTMRDRGARAEAADRQRHRRPAVARHDHADRSADVPRRAARRRSRRCAGRSQTRTDLDAGAQDARQQRRHAEVPAQPDAAGARPDRQLRRRRASAARSSSAGGRRQQPDHRHRFPAATATPGAR